jgi:hypothetical protein
MTIREMTLRNHLALTALFALALAAPAAAAGEMSVAAFLTKVDALKSRGFGALFSPDVGLLRSEATAAGMAYSARLKQEKAAGHPSSCPPSPVKVGQDMWLSHLRSYPENVRSGISLNRAMAEMFIKTWPCRR